MYGDWKTTWKWHKLKLFCTDLTNLDLNCNDFFPTNGRKTATVGATIHWEKIITITDIN